MKSRVYSNVEDKNVHWMDYRNEQGHCCVHFVTWVKLEHINKKDDEEWFEQAKKCKSCNAWLNNDLSNFDQEQYNEWEKDAKERD